MNGEGLPRRGLAVIGTGNVVRSDDAVGVHAVRRLRDRSGERPGVALIEGGTAGILLLPHIADAYRVIVVDAVAFGGEPGALIRLDPSERRFAHGHTAHDAGLVALLDAARLTGAWPHALILHGVQPESTALGTQLTPRVESALDLLVDAIEADIAGWCRHIAPVSEPAR